ncbi:hypothetical protein [Fodinicola feengrottensis]|uniref:hypothetical protein n=1 Tax=Fodinicola feengrottensis TaxID=435914 RepID=UPI0013D33C1B|nr:hypothetical protein [Fodinicola feengrottensis]
MIPPGSGSPATKSRAARPTRSPRSYASPARPATARPRDQWVTIVGGFQRSADDMPQIAVTGVTPISAPPDPYE